MTRTVTIVTPENVEVSYQLAGFASRFMALLVDLIIQITLILLVQWMVQGIAGIMTKGGFGLASFVNATGMILTYLLFFAYATFFEMLWGGRTPGKRLFGLRVVRDGGYPITLFASALRNILRFLDFGIVPFGNAALILCGLPGLLCIFFSPTYKRLGDYAAGTLVIREAGASPFGARPRSEAAAVEPLRPFIKNLDRLTMEEYRIARRFTTRRRDLDSAGQAAVAARLAIPLMQKLEIYLPLELAERYADFLEALEQRYAEEYELL